MDGWLYNEIIRHAQKSTTVTRGGHAIDRSNAHKICVQSTHMNLIFFFLVAHLVSHPSSLFLFGTDSPPMSTFLATWWPQKILNFHTKEFICFLGKKCTKVTRCPGKYFPNFPYNSYIIISKSLSAILFVFIFHFNHQNKNFLKLRHPQRPGHVDLK